MIRLESSGNDCTMGAGFRENSVYSTYTPNKGIKLTTGTPCQPHPPGLR